MEDDFEELSDYEIQEQLEREKRNLRKYERIRDTDAENYRQDNWGK